MTYLEIGPLLSAALFVIVAITIMLKDNQLKTNSWIIPAMFCAIFTLFSVITVIEEGPLGFWPNHTQDLWGNQVWFDLLFALAMVWVLLVPKAKALGMRLPLWLLFICMSGSIGMSAMLTRYFYLQSRRSS